MTETNLTIEEIKEIDTGWTSIQVDSQVLSIFMACPQKYKYVIVDRLQPVGGQSNAIRRGLIVHSAAMEYWKERIATGDYKIAVQKALQRASVEFNKDSGFDKDYKQDSLHKFLEFLKYIQTLSWIPKESEKYFKIKIYENEAERLRIYITGRIDLILQSPQVPILPVDMKTEAERWFYTQMSNQFKIYNLACGTNMLGVQRIGFQDKVKVEDKYKMEILPFDQDILDEFKNETLPHYVKEMIRFHKENFFPMNPSNCVHGHFKCQFSDAYNGGICNISRQVRAQKLQRYFVVGEAWDPSKVD